MTQKFYADKNGNYLGSFIDCAPPEGAVEVPQPSHGWARWNGAEWESTPELDALAKAPIYAQIEALEKKQLRAMREALLGDDAAKEYLLDIDLQIAALREQLK